MKSRTRSGVNASLFAVLLFLASPSWSAELKPFPALVRVVDLSLGESAQVTLHNGSEVELKLTSLEEHRDAVRHAVYGSTVGLSINGTAVALDAGPYHLPERVAGVQVDCTATGGLNSNGTPADWGLKKDARIRLWPADSPLLQPGSMIYPVDQGWLATRTWYDNEPVHAGNTIKPQIYYHAGMDIGASEGLTQVIAATDALVVQRGETVLDGHTEDTPCSPRYDVVYLMDGRGWYYRYSHLKEIAPNVQPGTVLRQGEPVGIAGKEGASGGWSHLHFEIKSRQPSGAWGTQAAFAFFHEAYVRDFDLKLYANARPAHMITAGESVTLDGSRSWSADDSITDYTWTLHDGTTRSEATVSVPYAKPGFYCETLKVSNRHGETSYDFAYVMVLDPQDLTQYTPSVNINHYPSRDIQAGQAITFKARAFRMKGGEESWDFGDGSPPQTTRSPEEAAPLAPEGYVAIEHTYGASGDYIVTVSRTHDNGLKAAAKAWVHVAPAK